VKSYLIFRKPKRFS